MSTKPSNTGTDTENTPRKKGTGWRRFKRIAALTVLAGFALFFVIHYYYPFGEGVKTGQLNFVVRKGILFKTYEGRLIQSGFRSEGGSLQSNEFNFSISNAAVADTLMHAGGQVVELHYKEYFGTLPWRGYSKYIVDRIVRLTPAPPVESIPPYAPQP